MNVWPTVPLSGTVGAKGIAGGPFGSSLVGNDYVPCGVPVIRGTNLSNGRHVAGDFVFVSEDKFKADLARNSAEPGDLVFTQRGTLGQVALVPRAPHPLYVISQSQMRLRVDPEVASSRYLYYACSSPAFVKQVHDNAIATGVPHINLGILSRLEVPLPPLEEQRGIADVLGALDDKVETNSDIIANATALAVSMLGHLSPSVRLRELVNHRKRSVGPADFGTSAVAHFSLPAFDAGQLPEIAHPAEIMSGKFRVEGPCVLVSKLNPRFPRIWNVLATGDQLSIASTEFLVLESRDTSTSVLWAVLSQPGFSAALEAKVAGTSGSHQRVRPDDLLDTPVIDPGEVSAPLRAEIDSLGELIAGAREESAQLAATRDSLLPLLLSGAVKVEAHRVLRGERGD